MEGQRMSLFKKKKKKDNPEMYYVNQATKSKLFPSEHQLLRESEEIKSISQFLRY